MILYCGDHDTQFDTDRDTETHRWCRDTAGRPLGELRLEVYGVDGAGVPWTVLETDSPRAALDRLQHERTAKHPNDRVFGVYDLDNPESGDVETELEELMMD